MSKASFSALLALLCSSVIYNIVSFVGVISE